MVPPVIPYPFDKPRTALVVAHPGHELRVHGWLELIRPAVCVLTDGSGCTGRSRLPSTTRTLENARAVPGPIYGRLTDAQLYTALLQHNFSLFLDLADELAGILARHRIRYVLGDSWEGYNSGHDVCRLLINAAIELSARWLPRRPENIDFALVADPNEVPDGVVRLELTPAALRRKLTAARAYPELAGEVAAALETFGTAGFAVECLRPVTAGPPDWAEPPFYERQGLRQVEAGRYRQVITYRDHVFPLAQSLKRQGQRSRPWAA